MKKLQNQSKTITVRTDPKTGDGFLLLEDFKDWVDIKRVQTYSLTEVKDNQNQVTGLVVKFFDQNGKPLK
jgi:hypothetical protein